MVGSKDKLDRGSVASNGEKFPGVVPGASQGGGASRSQGRDVEGCIIWQCRVDFELRLMVEIIFTESTGEERMRMPAQWREQPVQLFKWAVGEAKSRDQLRQRRWACIVGEVSCPPSLPAMQ